MSRPPVWQSNDLSVDPPLRQMGEGDVETLAFSAGQTVTSVAVTLRNLETNTVVDTDVLPSSPTGNMVKDVALESNIASVTVGDLERFGFYELKVRFSTASGRRWSRTLFLWCSA